MYWDVTDVQVVGHHTLGVAFQDGVKGMVRFEPSFFSGVFSPLVDMEKFKEVGISHGVVTWPGKLDLAPDATHRELKERGEWVLA